MTARTQYIVLSSAVLVALCVVIAALLVGFATPPLEDGGSPPWPASTLGPSTSYDDLITDGDSTLIIAKQDGYVDSRLHQYRFAAIADDAGPCATIGVDILARKSGSAVDAAIATMLCVGIVNCHSSGIGGGHFMTIYDRPRGESEKVLNTIIARERAPLNATRDMFVNASETASTIGGLAIAVPGEVKGFYHAWSKFGRVPWKELFEPTIQLCEEGHIVNPSLSGAIEEYEDLIRADPNLSELFVKEDGSLVTEGDILVRPKMAVTLRTIADDPLAFYDPNSQLAKDIIADIAEYDGIISLQDLNIYDVYDKDPTNVTLHNGNYSVYGVAPPSSGVIHNYALNILDGYNFVPGSINTTEDATLTYHRIAEAFKFAYAKRSALGDEEFVDIEDLMANLTSNAYADYTRSRITDDTTHDVEYYDPEFQLVEDGGTAHASIMGGDGSAVAITCTINLYFGSKVRGTRTGIFFNNEMDDFSTPGEDNSFGVPPSESNFIEPYKMPMSSMCPTLIADSEGVVRFMAGASGGTRITTGTANVAINALWFGMRLDNATDAHRLHHQLVPNELRVERGFDEAVLSGLEEKGHVLDRSGSIAVVQSIENTCTYVDEREYDCIHAVSDARKDGIPDGY